MFGALDKGYRPCLRCQPDLNIDYYNGNVDGTLIVKDAMTMIYNGYLATHKVSDLANQFYISDRHLRDLFIKNIGISPIKVAKYHKALFAKKLLVYSKMSITDVGYASGFGSTRQFNDVFKDVYRTTPTIMRKEQPKSDDIEGTVISIPYKLPFNYQQILDFMSHRRVKGVELIKDNVYYRTFRVGDASGYMSVANDELKQSLRLNVMTNDIRCIMPIYYKVKRMFDIDGDLATISDYLGKDKLLSKGMKDNTVPRLPVAFNTFEFVIRAILGQQITVKAATTLAGRLAEVAGIKVAMASEDIDYPEGLTHYFPTPEELSVSDISDVGITSIRQRTIMTVVKAILEKDLSLDSNQSFETFYKAFISLKGIGDWTVNYVAMRGLGMVDAFPAKDLGVIKALTVNGDKPSMKAMIERTKAWQPYRAYATLCLWQGLKA